MLLHIAAPVKGLISAPCYETDTTDSHKKAKKLHSRFILPSTAPGPQHRHCCPGVANNAAEGEWAKDPQIVHANKNDARLASKFHDAENIGGQKRCSLVASVRCFKGTSNRTSGDHATAGQRAAQRPALKCEVNVLHNDPPSKWEITAHEGTKHASRLYPGAPLITPSRSASASSPCSHPRYRKSA